MPATSLLLDNLRRDFPELTFTPGDMFQWSPHENVVYYANTKEAALLLHEVAHAALQHASYDLDIELLRMERDAWDYAASKLSKDYGVSMPPDEIEAMVDTYREWLHARSQCPDCLATGIQTAPRRYSCLACSTSWRVNEARICALRRYRQQ